MLINLRNAMLTTSNPPILLVVENACTNCYAANAEIRRLAAAKNIYIGVARVPIGTSLRYNMPLAFDVGLASSRSIPRYRNGIISVADTSTDWDADVRVGDVYEVLEYQIAGQS